MSLTKPSKIFFYIELASYLLALVTMIIYITHYYILSYLCLHIIFGYIKEKQGYRNRNSICSINYSHSRMLRIELTNNTIADAEIISAYISNIVIVLHLQNIKCNKRFNLIIASDQTDKYNWGKLKFILYTLKI